jgi:hypothetical protein
MIFLAMCITQKRIISTEKIAWKKSNIELLVTKVATIIFVRNILAFILNSKRKRSNSAKFLCHAIISNSM